MKVLIVAWQKISANLSQTQEIIFDKIIRFFIYTGIFLIPLFFIPLSDSFLTYSKEIAFLVIAAILSLLFIVKILVVGRINMHWRFADSWLILFLIIYFLASLLGRDFFNSLWGDNLQISHSFIIIGSLVVFYFFISRYLGKWSDCLRALQLLNFTLFLGLIIKMLQLFWPQFLAINNGLAINTFYFSLVLGVLLSGVLYLINARTLFKNLNLGLMVIFLAAIFVADYEIALLVLALALFIFILLISLKPNFLSNRLVVALTLLLFLTIIVLILPINQFTRLIAPRVFNLPLNYGWQISQATLGENLLLGAGPQNFIYSFFKFKPQSYNLTNYWQLSFEHNSNFWLELLNNVGLLGWAVFVLIVAVFLIKLIKYLSKLEEAADLAERHLFLLAAMGAFICCFLFWALWENFDFLLWLWLFIFFALAAARLEIVDNVKVISQRVALNLAGAVLLVLLLIGSYALGKIIYSDINSQLLAAKTLNSQSDYQKAELFLNKVLVNNSNFDDYYLQLSRLKIEELLFSINNKIDFDEVAFREQIWQSLEKAVTQPSNDARYFYQVRQLLEQLKNNGVVVDSAEKIVVDKLISLDANNPELYIDRALLNFSQYTTLKNNVSSNQATDQDLSVLIEKVQSDLEKSLALKDDYVLAIYNLGLFWQELNEPIKALTYMEQAYELDPQQKIIVLTLKKLYLNQDKATEASQVLEKYLAANSQDIEVRLELAKVYLLQDKDTAREEIEKILALEPDNAVARELQKQL